MDTGSSPTRATSSQVANEPNSGFRDRQEATKSSPPRSTARTSPALPSLFASFASSSPATRDKMDTPERLEENSPTKRSPAIETSLKSPHTAQSDSCHSTPICGVPPYSPHSDDRSSCGSASAATPQQFCLRWNNYQSNLTSVFDQLLQTESLVDVTLACDGRSIKAHKMVLSACSPYFQTLFSTTPCQHPIVIMRDVSWLELKSIVDFMYKGEINVSQDQIGPLLRIAEMLKVRGLADVGNLAGTSSATHLSTRQDQSTDKELYGSQTFAESPKRHETVTPPAAKRASCRSNDSDNERCELERDSADAEKKLRLEQTFGSDWDIRGSMKSTEKSNLELRLSPLQQQQQQQQHLLGRNIRKRRWPSADAIFNPPESPLSSLIAAERAEQERERERTREREREKSREVTLFTPPIPVTTCSSSNTSSGMSTSVLDTSIHMDITSPSPTPTPNFLPPARTPSGMLTPTPHLQISHHHTHQPHQSHRSSPASSATSTHPSSILSRPLTPSPASMTHTAVSSRLDASQMSTESHRFPLGPAQAAAMAAAAQMDIGSAAAMGMRPHSSSSSSMPTAPGHHTSSLVDDLEIKPGIAEMIREEERIIPYHRHVLHTPQPSPVIEHDETI